MNICRRPLNSSAVYSCVLRGALTMSALLARGFALDPGFTPGAGWNLRYIRCRKHSEWMWTGARYNSGCADRLAMRSTARIVVPSCLELVITTRSSDALVHLVFDSFSPQLPSTIT